MKRPLTPRLLFFFLLATTLLWLLSGHLLFLRLGYVFLLLLALAGGWAFFLARGLRLQREARSYRAGVGDIFSEQFRVWVETWPGCPWVEVFNESPLPGASGSRLLSRLRYREQRFYIARTLLTRRGVFPLGPTRLVTYDPFGLFQVEKEFPAQATLLVFPMIFPIPEHASLAGRLPAGKSVHLRTTEVTPHASGVREYLPGDPMKRIHWPTTARRGSLMVKEFEQDPQTDLWIFLDAQREAHASLPEATQVFLEESLVFRRPQVRLPRDSFEYAVSAAGSLARHFLLKKRSVGLVCSTAKFFSLWSERGERQLNKVMESLTFVQADGEISLLEMVSRQARILPLGAVVMLITPAPGEMLVSAVEILLRRHLRPLVIRLCLETFGGRSEDAVFLDVALSRLGVPYCSLAYGDDLAQQLALLISYI
ncbi:MAG: DUF58 domain-containing protein [Anaerolineales bacterium]|nr:DUF58 domain-containing protein [Anaerolineales bacterium]MCX7609549.1 DUF58 domain-containing protein [Anaerolineales bacterium]MDW8226656.1 DUF58 domain-containing protein [Anaerolineales bacterium]